MNLEPIQIHFEFNKDLESEMNSKIYKEIDSLKNFGDIEYYSEQMFLNKYISEINELINKLKEYESYTFFQYDLTELFNKNIKLIKKLIKKRVKDEKPLLRDYLYTKEIDTLVFVNNEMIKIEKEYVEKTKNSKANLNPFFMAEINLSF